MNTPRASDQVGQLLELLNEESRRINSSEIELDRIIRDYSDLESLKTRTLDEISGQLSLSSPRWFGIGISSPHDIFFETALELARKKRQIDRCWSEYHRSAREYESACQELSSKDGSDVYCDPCLRLSDTLQQNMEERDRLFTEHENLVAEFIQLKSRNQQIRAFLDENTLKIIEPQIQLIDLIDNQIERNQRIAENLRSRRDASKVAYRRVLVRLEEISTAIHKEPGSPG